VIEPGHFLAFVAACLLLALTPGPNMIYLVSRSICQGRTAGIFSLLGVMAGVMLHMFSAVVGLSAVFHAVPILYKLLKFAGAAYLLWLAWEALKPGSGSPFELRQLPSYSSPRLLITGLMTSLLNPKVAIFYLSLFPQFVDPGRGSVFAQSLMLGLTQNLVAFTVNLTSVLSAASIAAWLYRNAFWRAAQQKIMGIVLAALALRLALDERR